ncbi:hypothetical protein OCU04_001452 [Sclerotinia nivalis]|uniref:Uncharacterized protein n=1 Tax=Sclerotinia nivalis TaxID=352851 RepID=A0A9X0AY74_9HELO|nr:hypothetical protein OCU04_001452 [Sclerotinia nivalis]
MYIDNICFTFPSFKDTHTTTTNTTSPQTQDPIDAQIPPASLLTRYKNRCTSHPSYPSFQPSSSTLSLALAYLPPQSILNIRNNIETPTLNPSLATQQLHDHILIAEVSPMAWLWIGSMGFHSIYSRYGSFDTELSFSLLYAGGASWRH